MLINSLYFNVITLTLVGHGDVAHSTLNEVPNWRGRWVAAKRAGGT
ncbi:MAG: hypothetical protein ACR2QO_13005 [Acidimicrobiales bacterium]